MYRILLGAALLGFVTGQALPAPETSGKPDDYFCGNLETEIQENMSSGFVNCVSPKSLNASLSEKVSESSSLRCVCRKVVGGRVGVYPISTAG
jgi:hypothetical protein